MADLRELRILVDYNGGIRKLCKLTFTSSDASIYIFPYSSNRRFYCGSSTIEEKAISDTVNYGFNTPANFEPKLSIHQLGKIHIKNQYNDLIGPLKIPELATLRGEHVATVCADNFDGLKIHDKQLIDKDSEKDHVIPVEKGVHSGRLAFYINGEKPTFDGEKCRLIVGFKRESLNKVMYLGIKIIPQDNLGLETKPGVTIISGWNPVLARDAVQDYLYIRGE